MGKEVIFVQTPSHTKPYSNSAVTLYPAFVLQFLLSLAGFVVDNNVGTGELIVAF
jgi:hypothetical protein